MIDGASVYVWTLMTTIRLCMLYKCLDTWCKLDRLLQYWLSSSEDKKKKALPFACAGTRGSTIPSLSIWWIVQITHFLERYVSWKRKWDSTVRLDGDYLCYLGVWDIQREGLCVHGPEAADVDHSMASQWAVAFGRLDMCAARVWLSCRIDRRTIAGVRRANRVGSSDPSLSFYQEIKESLCLYHATLCE